MFFAMFFGVLELILRGKGTKNNFCCVIGQCFWCFCLCCECVVIDEQLVHDVDVVVMSNKMTSVSDLTTNK